MTFIDLDDVDEVEPFAVPPGRGLWRLTVHNRRTSYTQQGATMQIGQLLDARSRRLELAMNATSTLTFSIPGRSTSASMLHELTTEIWVWRWNPQTQRDVAMFAGVVTSTQDSLSEQEHTVSVTCQDYSAMLKRRYLATPLALYETDQDLVVNWLLTRASDIVTNTGVRLAAQLPLYIRILDPAGNTRAISGRVRTRNYDRSAQIYELLENLSQVLGGFDWGVSPGGHPQGADGFDVYYPQRGVARSVPLVYGWNVASLSRYVSSNDYANWQMLTGDNPDPELPPPYAEVWNADALSHLIGEPGLWMNAGAAADVREQTTLSEQALGLLDETGVVVPSYYLTLRPGAYDELREAQVGIGDVVPLVIHSGRLQVDTHTRILSVTFEITDDGTEEVSLNCGRPDLTLLGLFRGADRRIAALERR